MWGLSVDWQESACLFCIVFFVVVFTKDFFSSLHWNRLQALERSLIIENGETSPVVQDMKLKVNSFKEKLEVCKFDDRVVILWTIQCKTEHKGNDHLHNYLLHCGYDWVVKYKLESNWHMYILYILSIGLTENFVFIVCHTLFFCGCAGTICIVSFCLSLQSVEHLSWLGLFKEMSRWVVFFW